VKVVVTGANGFVGKPLCAALLASGHEVRALIRRDEALRALPEGAEAVVLPRLDESTDWSQALSNADAVVHLVARTHVLEDKAADPLSAYRATNVGLTEALVRAAIAAGVRRFVFMSSIKAAGENADAPYSETMTPQPQDAYGVSKLEAEGRLLELSAGTGLEPVVLRPPLVYGPGVKANFLRLMKALDRGLPLPLGAVRNARSMVYVGNLASAVAAALTHPGAAGEMFHVADRETLSTSELLLCLGALLGRPARLLPVPAGLLRLGGRALNKQGEMDRLLGSLTVSTEKIHRSLGWSAPYPVQEGLEETVDWFRSLRA
jgi:nucleoside-diphosphate-sugar epimerase